MMEFYNCRGGRQFIDGTVPGLIEVMGRMAKAMERQNELKEMEMGLRPKTDIKAIAREFASDKTGCL